MPIEDGVLIKPLVEMAHAIPDVRPFIAGSNVGEGDLFSYLSWAGIFNMPPNTYRARVDDLLFSGGFLPRSDALKQAVLEAYPQGSLFGDSRPPLANLMTDHGFVCGTYAFADIVAATRRSTSTCNNSFLYRFAVPLQCPVIILPRYSVPRCSSACNL